MEINLPADRSYREAEKKGTVGGFNAVRCRNKEGKKQYGWGGELNSKSLWRKIRHKSLSAQYVAGV